ncbi:hypothetical protein O1R50_07410 [Glycomyces luteolus]|uniref:Secreted protein n=1 Tax=Glycomyces luteolus TaxID=2670330 RepID=A0A9X3SPK0_9ACTN|nr:hypothetical protein [Glycomyces luteolus]MDA1359442.1 hypothetical protein [Glycomyces luteolus]
MRYQIIAAAGVAAAAIIPAGSAAASTPDWLTLASVETGPTPVSALCEEAEGSYIDPACANIVGNGGDRAAEVHGESMPETHEGPGGMPTVANVDLRDFAKWQVCGVNVAATGTETDCDNSTSADREPVGADNGMSLVNVDATGAFEWNVCGVAVLQADSATDC